MAKKTLTQLTEDMDALSSQVNSIVPLANDITEKGYDVINLLSTAHSSKDLLEKLNSNLEINNIHI